MAGEASREPDPRELEAFLASAPESLREWADAEIASLHSKEEAGDGAPAGRGGADGAPSASADLAGKGPVGKRRKPEKTSTARGINKVLVAALAAAIVLLVQQWGRPAPEPQAAPPHGDVAAMPSQMTEFEKLDQQRVDELKGVVEKHPDDVAALRELAQLHNKAGLWDEASDYHTQVLEHEPNDVDSLLSLGVIQFNKGQLDEAEATWLRASEAKPDMPEPYFNLGFVYVAKKPSEIDKAKEMWQKLIDVAPDSELAKTAKSHIDSVSGD